MRQTDFFKSEYIEAFKAKVMERRARSFEH